MNDLYAMLIHDLLAVGGTDYGVRLALVGVGERARAELEASAEHASARGQDVTSMVAEIAQIADDGHAAGVDAVARAVAKQGAMH
jgi:hypothetical protein